MTRSHPEHEHWHGNIGEPVAIDVGEPVTGAISDFDVLSWNIAIGNGRLVDLVTRLRAGAFDGIKRSDSRPLVILVQEAFRADESVPERISSPHHGGKHPRTSRNDIVTMADELGLSLRYFPSMRNGEHRSDRGNAILSNVAIASARPFALPHVRQMRVALSAELVGLPWLTFACAHLDTRGRVRAGDLSGGGENAPGRAAQAAALGERLARDSGPEGTVLIGADLNSYFGGLEPLFDGLINAGFRRIPHTPLGSHTFHATPLRMALDHILVRGAGLKSIAVTRLDEDPSDRGRTIFGSDHHPLLARIEVSPQNRGQDSMQHSPEGA
jgi:endonuclease/exonuclease/phosphatase family metal-dependent hydrolase